MLKSKTFQIGDVDYIFKYFETDKDVLDYVIKELKVQDSKKKAYTGEFSSVIFRGIGTGEVRIHGPTVHLDNLKKILRKELFNSFEPHPRKIYELLEEYRDSMLELGKGEFFDGDLIDFPLKHNKYLSFYRMAEKDGYKWVSDFCDEKTKEEYNNETTTLE